MSPVWKAVLAVLGFSAGGLLAHAIIEDRRAANRRRNPLSHRPRAARLRTAGQGSATVGARARQPGDGTLDWWIDRHARRRQKHLRMLTAKG